MYDALSMQAMQPRRAQEQAQAQAQEQAQARRLQGRPPRTHQGWHCQKTQY